jgi:hypothetical protein
MSGPDLRQATLRGLQVGLSAGPRDLRGAHADHRAALSLDEAYLDVTENLQNIPLARDVALAIRAKIKEVTWIRE